MEIKDLQSNQGNIDLVLLIAKKSASRTFEKFGRPGRVCTATAQDDSGEIKLTLWNEDIDKIEVGDKIHLQNGWCSEYQGEKQLSTGKFGKIEVIEKASPSNNQKDKNSQKDKTKLDKNKTPQFVTNDPSFLKPSPLEDSDEGGELEEPFSDEEMIE